MEAAQEINTQPMESTTPDAPEITLENLKAGKFTIKDIPRAEQARLWREEYSTLEDGAKIIADSVGWKTKHFFLGKRQDGTAAEFKDWKEFEKDVKEKLPIANERLKHITKEKLEADEKIAQLEKRIADMTKLQRMQAERELRKDKSSIDAEMQEAFELGDRQKFVAAQERKAQIESEEKILKEFEPQQVRAEPKLSPEVIMFKASNPWFEQDKVMTRYAKQLDAELGAQYPNMPLSQRFQMVEDEIKVEFADKFHKAAAPQAPAVESGRAAGRLTLDRGGDIDFDQLPEDERNRAERMIKQGIVKSKTDFMKGFNADRKTKKY
jgi:vacuolar-type H+-ATPase subunit I/STV1